MCIFSIWQDTIWHKFDIAAYVKASISSNSGEKCGYSVQIDIVEHREESNVQHQFDKS